MLPLLDFFSLILMNIGCDNNKQIQCAAGKGEENITSFLNTISPNLIISSDTLNLNIKNGDKKMKEIYGDYLSFTLDNEPKKRKKVFGVLEEVLLSFISFVNKFEEETNENKKTFCDRVGKKVFYDKINREYLPLFGIYVFFLNKTLRFNVAEKEIFKKMNLFTILGEKNKYLFSSSHFEAIERYQNVINKFFLLLEKNSSKLSNKFKNENNDWKILHIGGKETSLEIGNELIEIVKKHFADQKKKEQWNYIFAENNISIKEFDLKPLLLILGIKVNTVKILGFDLFWRKQQDNYLVVSSCPEEYLLGGVRSEIEKNELVLSTPLMFLSESDGEEKILINTKEKMIERRTGIFFERFGYVWNSGEEEVASFFAMKVVFYNGKDFCVSKSLPLIEKQWKDDEYKYLTNAEIDQINDFVSKSPKNGISSKFEKFFVELPELKNTSPSLRNYLNIFYDKLKDVINKESTFLLLNYLCHYLGESSVKKEKKSSSIKVKIKKTKDANFVKSTISSEIIISDSFSTEESSSDAVVLTTSSLLSSSSKNSSEVELLLKKRTLELDSLNTFIIKQQTKKELEEEEQETEKQKKWRWIGQMETIFEKRINDVNDNDYALCIKFLDKYDPDIQTATFSRSGSHVNQHSANGESRTWVEPHNGLDKRLIKSVFGRCKEVVDLIKN